MHRLLNQNSARLNPNLFRHALAAQKHWFSTNLEAEKNLPTHAQAVIVGGGVVGSSLAYHLTNMGWKDVHLLEQAKATSGTTWHAAGLVGTSRATSTETKLSIKGAELYERLEEETGLNAGFKRCGSLTVARTKERLEALERNAARSRAFGLPAEIVGPEECGKLQNGLINTHDLEGGLWLPMDGSGSPTDLTMSLLKGARNRGAQIHEDVRVDSIDAVVQNSGKRRVTGVTTSSGKKILSDVVVLCGGQWSRQIGAACGVNVPLHSAEHFYVITKAIEGCDLSLPVFRDPDALIYCREWGGGLCVGGFELDAKPVFGGAAGVPKDFAFGLFDEDWDHFATLYEGACERYPILNDVEVQSMVNGPESFTIDNQYILGEAPELDNLYVCGGMNSSGIASAGGAGFALAEWITAGGPTMDMWAVDLRRFGPQQANLNFLAERTKETLGLHYQMPWPRRELVTARNLRLSALFTRLSDQGAVFGQKFGWERPNYFAHAGDKDHNDQHTFGKPDWLKRVRAEHLHTRKAVSIFDQSSFAKIVVQGRDAEKFMQRVCCNNMAVENGKVVYTGLLNEKGGFETDVTATRVDQNTYFVVCPTAQATRDMHVMKRRAQEDEFVTFSDVTSSYAVLGVMGPDSATLLEAVGPEGVNQMCDESFPFGTSKTVGVGSIQAEAKRISFVGELGWELYVPTECATHAYEALFETAKEHNIDLKNAGYYAIDSLRVEKGYRAWGHDLTTDYTPLEAGLGFMIDWSKDFVGKQALQKQKDEGLQRRMLSFVLEDPDAMPWGDEAIWMDGKIVGYCTSTTFGHTVGSAVTLGYVEHEDVKNKGFLKRHKFEISLGAKQIPAKAQFKPVVGKSYRQN